ncbi:biotin synthase BioB, partial [Streptomyces violens]|uniref:biotin synthase BioB n=1 Tax=Streptomyces violens TaxID=66377 RepID=UPI0004C1F257
MDLLNALVEKGLRRESPTREEALAVLATSDDELLDVVAAAGKVRRQWFGRRVKLNYLVNLKSGLCPEDCSYCSQRLGSKAEILKYTWLKPDEATTTHTYEDRVSTVQQAQAAGMSACSGLIAGMGETDEDLVDVVFSLRELDPDSVPVNFLIPFEGTPLAKEWNLTPQRALRILAMVRFVCPDVEANSIFLGDYLTSEGQAGKDDLAMIADAGFEVEGADTTTLPAHRADAPVAVRRRGAGTDLAPNA